MKYYDVLLPVPVGGVYTYIYAGELKAGQRVMVPLGKRELFGIVLSESHEIKENIKYREVIGVPDDFPLFNGKYLHFLKQIASYYCTNEGGVLRGVLSETVLGSEQSVCEIKYTDRQTVTLSQPQEAVYDSILPHLDKGFSVHLVHGVTGSGKTEIFIELSQEVIKHGKQILYLVPEISLTPQMEERLSKRSGFSVMSYHSKKTPKKRKEAFWTFAKGGLPMLLGARSALFLPSDNIGLIIIDEEHESSYKQEDNPPYQLRDMAVLYAKILNVPIILSSATPSVESWYNATTGKYHLHSIPCRPDADMPDIEIVDMKEKDLIGGMFCEELYEALYNTIQKGEQAILLINRKGYSHTLYCRKCGQILTCPNCSVAVTYYKSKGLCKCHYCSSEMRKLVCPECGSEDMADYGAGTEKAAEVLESMFGQKVLRLDTDNASGYKELSKMLKDFENGEYSIMAGTQLVAKGLDFKNVTLAGVINIDNMFSLPDFRANERAYQLLVQVAGRAGRSTKKGRVIIQTNVPEMDVFRHMDCSDTSFYDMELMRRKAFNYPPYYRMCRVTLSHAKEDMVKDAAMFLYGVLRQHRQDAEVFYPAQAPVYKIANRYRYAMVIKTKTAQEMSRIINIASASMKESAKTAFRVKFDRDPQFFM